jgi:ribosomal protein L31
MARLARQPRAFPQVLVLANGATVTVRSTVPKRVVKLATDPTVHPAWNPDRGKGAVEQTGQMSRFLRRFESYYDAAGPSPTAGDAPAPTMDSDAVPRPDAAPAPRAPQGRAPPAKAKPAAAPAPAKAAAAPSKPAAAPAAAGAAKKK